MSTKKSPISPVEDIIDAARNGKMFILVDAEDRENEGDLVIPAQFATPDQVNFMAKHGRGLICLSLTADRAQQLDLRMMSDHNRSRNRTNFTVSIEAREGVSTGISAQDRARTIAVAIDPTKSADDLASPGHVFPLVARDGGVLTRAGHTEAAVDVSRLAGLTPAGVICEIMNDDGSMARLPDLVPFAKKHGMKIGAIADLIAYRRRNDRFMERRLETDFESRWGKGFRLTVFRNRLDGGEHVALVKGRPRPDQPTLVRMHKIDFPMDVLGGTTAPGRLRLEDAMATLAAHDGPSVLVCLRETHPSAVAEQFGAQPLPHRAPQNTAKTPPKTNQETNQDTGSETGDDRTLRAYGVGAQILLDLGVQDMVLLTNSPRRLAGLEGYGLKVTGVRGLNQDEPAPAELGEGT